MSKLAEWIGSGLVVRNSGRVDGHLVCVGDLLRDCGYPNSIKYAADVDIIDWPELTAQIATQLHPMQVFSAAVSLNFDCVEISQLLTRTGFQGRYRVVAPGLPDPEMIKREVKGLCPELDFAVLREPPASMVRRN